LEDPPPSAPRSAYVDLESDEEGGEAPNAALNERFDVAAQELPI